MNLPAHIFTRKHNSAVNDDTIAAIQMYVTLTSNIVDVGAGDGFYAKLIRHYVPLVHITGIELTPEYLDKFELRPWYNNIIVGNIVNEIDNLVGDVVIFGDVLEHLNKEEALGVVDKAVTRFGTIIINGPVGFQPQPHENPAEHHRCGFTKEDFMKYNPIVYKEFCNGAMMHLVIKGEVK